MIHDLRTAVGPQRVRADVCIIGSGPAGLTVARALAEKNLSVVIVEAGGTTPVVVDKPADVSFGRDEYRGATLGRAFGVGGTSAIWGGQLLPLRIEEMRARPAVGCLPWPIEYAEIERHYATIQDWVGVDADPFDVGAADAGESPLAGLRWGGLSARYSKWIVFGGRNLAKAWLPGLRVRGRTQIWTHATVYDWVVDSQGRVRETLARSPSGHQLQVESTMVVVCAGALESARLVLELLERPDPPQAPAVAVAGRYLQDHLSVRIGTLRLLDRARFTELFAPMFRGAIMRSPRLDLAVRAGGDDALPAAYVHFVMETASESGFAAVRDTLRALQAGSVRRALASSVRLLGALPELIELAYWRVVRKRLVFPAGAAVHVQLDFEQPQSSDNRLLLSEERDASGRRGVIIDWHAACDPADIIEHTRQQLRSFWSDNNLDEIAELRFVDEEAAAASSPSARLHDIHHPAGTTRMANDAQAGVVGPDLRVFGTTNCYVASTSVFPSIGAANPTLTLMALAVRLAEHIAEQLTGTSGHIAATNSQ